MNCRTCKYWKRDPDSDYGYGNCQAIKSDLESKPLVDEPFACIEAESISASLITGPDFGCLMFENKD